MGSEDGGTRPGAPRSCEQARRDPDVHYGDDRHWVAGDRGWSEWLLTGTTTDGERIAVRGCDLFEFTGEKIIRKDSNWKIVEPPGS